MNAVAGHLVEVSPKFSYFTPPDQELSRESTFVVVDRLGVRRAQPDPILGSGPLIGR
jgi:hypothetical protein